MKNYVFIIALLLCQLNVCEAEKDGQSYESELFGSLMESVRESDCEEVQDLLGRLVLLASRPPLQSKNKEVLLQVAKKALETRQKESLSLFENQEDVQQWGLGFSFGMGMLLIACSGIKRLKAQNAVATYGQGSAYNIDSPDLLLVNWWSPRIVLGVTGMLAGLYFAAKGIAGTKAKDKLIDAYKIIDEIRNAFETEVKT